MDTDLPTEDGNLVGHARVAPSSLHLTVPCPGSLQLQERVPPQPPTEEEAEGEAAHAVAMWRASATRKLVAGEVFEYRGRAWVADIDMIAGAEMWARECTVAGRFENPVSMPQIAEGNCYGTPDFWHYHGRKINVLEVKDYKYGFRFVDVFENYQLVAYALGVVHLLQLPENTVVRLVIVQPRAYHTDGPIRGWATTVGGLGILLKKLRAAAGLALGENPPTKTGPHCLDCKARAACKTLASAALGIVDYAGTAELMELTHEALGTELRILDDAMKRLEARRDGLSAQVEALLRGGIAVPYYGLKPGRASLTWNDDVSVEEFATVAELLGFNARKPAELLTPTQAKGIGIPEAIITQYATKATPKLVLKPDDIQFARKVFAVDKTVSSS